MQKPQHVHFWAHPFLCTLGSYRFPPVRVFVTEPKVTRKRFIRRGLRSYGSWSRPRQPRSNKGSKERQFGSQQRQVASKAMNGCQIGFFRWHLTKKVTETLEVRGAPVSLGQNSIVLLLNISRFHRVIAGFLEIDSFLCEIEQPVFFMMYLENTWSSSISHQFSIPSAP